MSHRFRMALFTAYSNENSPCPALMRDVHEIVSSVPATTDQFPMAMTTPILPLPRVCLSGFLIAILASASAHAEPKPIPLSIDGLVSETLTRNPEIRFYKAEITVAKAERS